MTQNLWLPIKFPSLNDMIDVAKTDGRWNFKFRQMARKGIKSYAAMKNELTSQVAFFAQRAKLKPVKKADFEYLFYEEDRRRDKSNVASVALKCIEDGLIAAKVLSNDGWKQVRNISLNFKVVPKASPELAMRPRPGVMVLITEVETEEVEE